MNGKVYMIRNEVNGKRYIGQTVNSLEERFKQHKQGTRQPKKNMTKLQKAMDKYGKPMFTITLIEDHIETIELLAEREKFFIEKFNTKEEYNSTNGGENKLRIKTTIHKNSGLLILHSNFNEEVIPKLNLREQKLFMLLLSKVNCTNTTIEINIDEILEFMNCEYEKPSSIKQLLTSLSIKIDKVKYPFLDENCNSLQKEKLFTLLLYNSEKEVIQVLLNSNLRYLVNKTRQRDYFSIPLNVIQNIDSRYGQILYRLLSSIKQKRTLTLNRNDLIYLLDCPPSYDIKKFHKLVLEPAIESVKDFFPGLAVEKIKKGKVITTYKFTFDKQTSSTKWDPGFKTEKRKPKNSAKMKSQVVSYENNFKNGYIPGNNSPVIGFNKWLTDLKIFVIYDEYFKNRFLAKNKIKELYKQFVIDESYSDMMFFAGMMEVIARDDAMNEWTLEENFSKVRHGKSRAFISQEVFNSLPEDKARELKTIYENSNNDDNDWVVI